MTATNTSGRLGRWYENRIGEAPTEDEVRGYWLFFLGVLTGITGLVVVTATEAGTTPRGVGYAIAGLAPVCLMLSALVRLPLQRASTYLAGFGAATALGGIVWFLAVFPGGWTIETGHFGVIVTYTAGLTVIGIAGAFVPLITDPVDKGSERR